MKAWKIVASKAPLEQFDEPMPVPTGSEVVVEVTHCGVCHSDLHFWKGEYNMGGGKVMRLADRGVTLPRAPGHEIAGRVVAMGPDASGVKIGDVRVVYPWLGCGECAYCLSERDNMCASPKGIGTVRDGGFGSHVVVPHATIFSYVITFGELLVGIAIILGAFTGIAAFFGAMMNLNYLFAGTLSINPLLLLIELFLILAWRTAG